MGVSSARTGGGVPCGHLTGSPEIDLSLHLRYSLLLLPVEKPLCPFAPNEPESREPWMVACLRPAGFLGLLGGGAGRDFSEILEAERG